MLVIVKDQIKVYLKLLILTLLISCSSGKNMNGTYSESDFRGEIVQTKISDIKKIDVSECTGSIIDQVSNEKVAFATVLIKNNFREYRGNTDSIGHFEIDKIIGGKYQIQVYFLGYFPFTDTIEIESGKRLEYLIKIYPDLELKL